MKTPKLIKFLTRILFPSYVEYVPYRIPLEELIQRSIDRMIVKDPRCPHCDGYMMFRHSTIKGGGIGLKDGTPIRDDITFKCVRCFNLNHFGIPITKSVALKDLWLRNGNTIMRPTVRHDETKKIEVLKRLKALGYIEFE